VVVDILVGVILSIGGMINELDNVAGGEKPFYGLFAGAEKLVNSTERKLVLPATTLKEG
jgi:hypothetical protein